MRLSGTAALSHLDISALASRSSRLSRALLACSILCSLLRIAPGATLHAQALPAHPVSTEDGAVTPDATTNDSGPIGVVPLVHGFNATLTSASQHDSVSGWSSTLAPTLAYRFSPHFSLFGGTTAYAYVLTGTVLSNKKAVQSTAATPLRDHTFVLGDTVLNATYEANPHLFAYAGTVTLGLPTGDSKLGLGAGQVTWNVNNHFERPVLPWLTPELELGIGDSENLDNPRVLRGYIVTGTVAHFQTGVDVDLPFNLNFSTDAYEDLPLGSQTVTTTTSRGKKGKQAATNTGNGAGEDNGFVNTLDVPLTAHITLSGIYNRSLRNHEDTAGFSLTFLLRPTPHGREEVPR